MSIDDTDIPLATDQPGKPESVPVEPETQEDQELDLTQDSEAVGDEEADQADDDLEETEFEGKKYLVPKPLKAALLKNADYTRKTQEIAETRKALDVEKAQVQQARAAVEKFGEEIGELQLIDRRLAQFKNADWTAIETEQGPAEAARLFREYNLLKDARGEVVRTIQQKQQEQALETQREAAKRFEEGKATVAKEIPGWSQKLAEELNSYGVSNGFGLDELASAITEPRYVKILHKAFLYDQAMAKQKAAKQTSAPAIEPKPVPQVGSRRSPVSFDPVTFKGSTEEWMRLERQRLASLTKKRA